MATEGTESSFDSDAINTGAECNESKYLGIPDN